MPWIGGIWYRRGEVMYPEIRKHALPDLQKLVETEGGKTSSHGRAMRKEGETISWGGKILQLLRLGFSAGNQSLYGKGSEIRGGGTGHMACYRTRVQRSRHGKERILPR